MGEWQVLMLELITLYMVQGGHSNKVVQFTTYHRMMLRMGQENVYTYESLIEADTQIRSRATGQGPNFSWALDDSTKHIYLKSFHKKEVKTKPKSSSSRNPKQSRI